MADRGIYVDGVFYRFAPGVEEAAAARQGTKDYQLEGDAGHPLSGFRDGLSSAANTELLSFDGDSKADILAGGSTYIGNHPIVSGHHHADLALAYAPAPDSPRQAGPDQELDYQMADLEKTVATLVETAKAAADAAGRRGDQIDETIARINEAMAHRSHF